MKTVLESFGIGATALLLLLGRIAPARAGQQDQETPATPNAAALITVLGTCPSSDAVSTAVAALIPHGGVDALPAAARIQVDDLGDSYRVAVATGGTPRARAYRDAARDCEQRARFAAVFIVLTLMPPELLVEAPPAEASPAQAPLVSPVAATPAPQIAVVVPPPAREPRFALVAAGLLDVAPAIAGSPAIVSPGVALRFAAGAGRFGLIAGAGIEPLARFSIAGLAARELRVPIEVGAFARARTRFAELAVEAGLGGALFNAGGTNSAMPASGTRLDLGARVGLGVRFGRAAARLAPVVGLHAEYFPAPYEIATVPAGVLGHMPSFRVGATAGAGVTF